MAFDFTGTDEDGSLEDTTNHPNANNDYTVMGWWLVDTGNNHQFCGHAFSSGDEYYRRSSGVLQFGFDDGGGFQDLNGTTSLLDGAWNHVCGRREGTTVTLFVNGVQDAQGTFDPGARGANTDIEICGVFDGFFTSDAGLHSFKHWTAALSDQEIASEYRAMNAIRRAGLHYEIWCLRGDPQGHDRSGNGFDLAVLNGPLGYRDHEQILIHRPGSPTGFSVAAAAGGSDITRTISDTIALSDQMLRTAEYDRADSDAVVVSDDTGAGVDYSVTVSDSIALSDTIAIAVEFARTLSDSLSLADQMLRTAEYDRSDSDAIVIEDQVSTEEGLQISVTVSDTLALTDTIDVVQQVERLISDALSVVDEALRSAEYDRSDSDAVVISDQTSEGLEYAASIADTLSVTDALQVARDATRSVSDSLSLLDDTSTEHDARRTISDAIALTDSITAVLRLLRLDHNMATIWQDAAFSATFDDESYVAIHSDASFESEV